MLLLRGIPMKKKIIPVFIVIGLIVLITAGLLLSVLVKKYTPSRERMSLTEYYHITAEDEAAIILDNEVIDITAKVIDQHVYLDYNFVHDHLNSRFYWDANENILLYTTASDVISAEADSSKYLVTKSAVECERPVVKASAESAWIDIDFVKNFTDFEYSFEENPFRIIMTSEWGERTVATAKKDASLRQKGGIKSQILTDVSKGDELTILEEHENWTKAATKDGIIGYIRNKQISDTSTKTLSSDFTEETFTHIKKEQPICMAWHQVTNTTANGDIASVLASTKGVNVISPTWFYLNDSKGNLADLASPEYVSYCHQQGVEVWALASNLENPDADTSKVLTHTSLRQHLVNQIVSMAIQYDLDGINLDFEAISSDVGDAYIQFVRELSIKLANNGVVLSVDNYAPTSYTAFYNRAEQANFADYVVIMGYDQHTTTSEEEGSVASLDWVTEAVDNTIKEVPADQIILGMPFYTRVWTLTPTGETKGESEDVPIDYSISAKAYGMSSAWNLVRDHGVEPVWLEECGQYYAQYESGDVVTRVWLENSDSMEERLRLLTDRKLAGASFWKLGFETNDVWDTIIKYL